jgi:hypothetical protein
LQMVLHANIVAAQCVSLSRASGAEALLPTPVGIGRFVHPSHPRAWGWRAVQSELGDGIS